MGDLRARLAGKSVRRAVIPIGVDDPTEQEEALKRAHVRLGRLGPDPSEKDAADAVAEVEKATAEYEACFVDVHLHALAADDYEALLEHFAIDNPDLDPEREDTVRWDDLLPELLAACADDEDLQDPDWWSGQLSKPEWSKGEKFQLREQLILLNSAVRTKAPKG